MADITLQSLSDLLAITQAQLDDLRSIVVGQDGRITQNESDINTLENPPDGVPPELQAWFDDNHTITEVDTVLGITVSGINTTLGTHTSDISTLTSNLATETTDRQSSDSDLQTQVDDLVTGLATTDGNVTQEIADRATLAASVAQMNADTNARIDDVISDLSDTDASATTSINSLDSQIASMSSALQMTQTQILQLQNIGVDPLGAQASQITALTVIANDAATDVASETTARTAADISLQTAINSVGSSVTGIQTSLTDEVDDRIAADAAINASLGTINTTLSSHTASIAAETAARIAADSSLNTTVSGHTTDIADNATAIAQETTDRTTADSAFDSHFITTDANVASNTDDIDTLEVQMAVVDSQFGVVKDGFGYVTGWQILDQSAAAGNFNIRNLNNDTRLQNPGYVGKYFPPVAMASFDAPATYDTQYGTGPSTLFRGTDTNDYTRDVNVYATASVGINGSVFMGVDYSTGGGLQRLGQVLTTFLVNISGYVNEQLSLWYRIKNTPGDTTQRWFPVYMTSVTKPSPATYEMSSGRAVVQISVTANQVIEFGLTNLSTLDASRSASNTVIYNGSVSVQALNMVTIS